MSQHCLSCSHDLSLPPSTYIEGHFHCTRCGHTIIDSTGRCTYTRCPHHSSKPTETFDEAFTRISAEGFLVSGLYQQTHNWVYTGEWSARIHRGSKEWRHGVAPTPGGALINALNSPGYERHLVARNLAAAGTPTRRLPRAPKPKLTLKDLGL